jgi:predicted DNA-binding transcriptional regulator AlpA
MTRTSAVNHESLVPLSDVADYFGVPIETFYSWRKKGKAPKGFKVGRAVKYRWSEVEAWLEAHREDQAS